MESAAARSKALYETMVPRLRPEVVDFLTQVYDLTEPHEADFNFFRKFQSNLISYIDVGANVGLTALSMNKCAKLAAGWGFEINPRLQPALDIASSFCVDYRYTLTGLSDSANDGILIVPLIDGYAEYGEASLSEDNFKRSEVMGRLWSYSKTGKVDFDHIPVKFDKLDNQVEALKFLQTRPLRLLKVDVEGHEASVLAGGNEFIKEARPIVLIEEGHRPEIIDMMKRLGYNPYAVTPDLSIEPLSGATLNTLFLNEAHLREFPKYTF
ncbi:FkbM family methyltransferase [Oryzifoliimicrobium ureilyticus]|uniref:FkbM family methyltransferase n=1 Tax=Oryzifoliimicrobium ureilyticus TaxID=3113724 RepID=UPI003075FE2B